jgi:hypothetical protein
MQEIIIQMSKELWVDGRGESNTICSIGHVDRTHKVNSEKPRVKEGEKTKLFTVPLASLTSLPVPTCLAH